MSIFRRPERRRHEQAMQAIRTRHEQAMAEIDEHYRLERQALIDSYRDKWDAEIAEMAERNRRHLANQRKISDDCWEFRSEFAQLVGQVSNADGMYRVDPAVWVNAGEWHRTDFDWRTRTATLTLVPA